MTIYDSYASSNGSTLPAECNHNTLPPSADSHAAPAPPLTYVKDDVDNMAAVGGSATLRQSVNHESRLPYRSPAPDVDMKGESGESDGPPAALGSVGVYGCSGGYGSDPSKKRPLSVSSTSSATSSTSSLPRPQRKKMAGGGMYVANGGAGSPLVPNGYFTGSVDYVTGSGAMMTSGVVPMSPRNGVPPEGAVPQGSVAIDMQVSMEEDGTDPDRASTTTSTTSGPHGEATRQDSATSSGSGAVSYIDKVVAEILETERTYVHDLNEIIQGYLYELRSDPESTLDDADINALFGNIEEIYDFNKVFLEELETCQEDAVRLAQCFVDQNEGFVIYSDYCTNYPGAVEVLTSLLDTPEKADMLRRQQARLDHNLPLGAYLLKPVQRILKYHLLLQNMLSHMEEGGGEVVTAALSSMTNMAAHINEMKRKHEHAVRYQEMQSLLYDWAGADLSAYGELVREETFRMHGAKGDRHLLLFQKGLVIAKHKDDTGLQIKDCIKCSNLMLVESVPREPLSFHVIPFDNPRGQHTFQARCLDQKREWCLELKRLILESYTADKAIPSNVKDLVLTLTSRDERSAREHGTLSLHAPGTPKPCPAPDYLDRKRRPRRRSVTSVLPDFAHLKSQVTKKVLPKKGDGASPKVSPRVRRRRSESAVPRENMAHLHHKLKMDGLCEDLSDTDSAEQGLFRSMESLHSTSSKTPNSVIVRPGRSRTHLQVEDPLDGSSITDGTWDDESGHESVDSTPTTSPGMLQWPEGDPRSLQDSPSPSPLKRRESFRIATMLHPVDSRKPPGGNRRTLQRSPASSEGQPAKEKRGPRFLRSWRRVSEGDLEYMNKSIEEPAPTDNDCGYVTVAVSPPVQLTPEEDGDDEAEDEPLYSTVGHPQIGVSLIEDNEGDFSEISLHSPLYARGDPNNNPTNNQALNNYTNNTEHRSHLRPVAQQGHLISKGLRVDAHGQRSQSCSPCLRVTPDMHSLNGKRSPRRSPSPRLPHNNSGCSGSGRSPTPLPFDSNLNDLGADQTGLYDNIHTCQWDAQDPTTMESYLNANFQLGGEEEVIDNGNVQTGRRKGSKSGPWVLQLGTPTNTVQGEPRQRLLSNSLSSLTDITQDPLCNHRRLPSDTMVFYNRSAYTCSGTPGTIKHDVDTERIIARLATPPRELGPSDIIQQIKESQERGLVVNQYATPPRTLSDSASLSSISTVIANSQSDESSPSVATSPLAQSGTGGPCQLRPRAHSTLPSDMRNADPAMWNDLEDYIAQSPSDYSPTVPRFPTTGSGGDNHFYRQTSLNETGSYNMISPPHSARSARSSYLSSPSSVTSSDSIVESLKQAVLGFTSRIASHLPRSTEASPRRAPRSRSISALEELRVENLQETISKPTPVRKKDRRGRFVAQLAKVYSEHVKKRRSTSIERSGSFNEKDSSRLTKQITSLLREHKPGSSVIGERMAASKPVVLGTYTLPRHRPPRPNKAGGRARDASSEVQLHPEPAESPDAVVRRRNAQGPKLDVESCHSSAYDSGCLDVGVKDLTLEAAGGDPEGASRAPTLQDTLNAFNLVCAGMDTDDDDDSPIYYYERQFVADLESNFGDDDDAFRDSAVYSDDGCAVLDPDAASPNVSIRDTMKLIEQRSRTRSVQRTEIRQEEKAKGIKDILRTLELAAQARLETDGQERPMDSEAIASEKAMLKSIRDRTRELVECATLTRIRQTACSVLEDMPSGEEDESTTEGGAAAASPPLRRGWVKQMVTLLQEHPDQLLSSSED